MPSLSYPCSKLSQMIFDAVCIDDRLKITINFRTELCVAARCGQRLKNRVEMPAQYRRQI